jgi:hypothetical protein
VPQRRSSKDFSCSKSLTSTESAERAAQCACGHDHSVKELTADADAPVHQATSPGPEPVFAKLLTSEV